MARRSISLVPFVLFAGALAALTLVARHALVSAQSNAPACVGNLNRTTYASGFQTSDFTSTTAADFVNGGLQLDTNLTPLNPDHIVLPFDQDVRVKSVYNNAGATHTLGWFYLDQIDGSGGKTKYFDQATQSLVDANGNGVPDLYEAIWGTSGGTSQSPLVKSASSYSDGGNYPHIPNLFEPYDPINNPSGIGNLVFHIMNDNTATGCTFTYNGVCMPPISDGSSVVDGIFDYDVNGNGVVGDEPDRTYDLGVIQGNRELVFYLVVYYGQTARTATFGQTGTGTQASGVVIHFTKTVLNTDIGGANPSDTISYIDIGAPGVKSTGDQCENATPASSPSGVPAPLNTFSSCPHTPYPTDVNNDATQQHNVRGWLSQPAIDRLNTATYGNLVLPHEVHRVTASPKGTTPHGFVGAPANDSNRWILGFEDLIGYTQASCSACSHSDWSLEDVVVLIERSNGGQVISQNVASDIPPAQLPSTIISHVHFKYTITLPSPQCDNDASAGVQLYYSVNGGTTWRAVPQTSIRTSGDVVVDVLATGDVGNTLTWKAVFTSSTQACQPILNHVDVGYDAVLHGEYKFAAPIPASNMVYSGTLETPAPSWQPAPTRNDFSLRGHFYATQLFDPATLKDSNSAPTWDAGKALSTRVPTTRYLFTNNNGVALPLTSANGTVSVPVAGTSATLFADILPSAVRALRNNGSLVYDYNGDAQVTDVDAAFVLEWTRGWEYPAGITFTPAPPAQPQQRAWPLAAVHASSPAIVGPPGTPTWLLLNAPQLTSYQAAFTSFQQTNQQRKALAIVGTQGGTLEGFNAGSLRQSPDPQCAVQLARGCFATVGGGPDYGDGSEVWGYVPARLLSSLKNNHPQTRSYLPTQNPTAEVDGSVSAEDIFVNGAFTTGVFASLGRNQPFVTALRIDAAPNNPQPLWTDDWTDVDFAGSNFSPGVTPFGQTPAGLKSLVVVSSGLSSTTTKTFLFVIDATTGALVKAGNTVVGKVALDKVGTTLGIAGYPNIVDANLDGIADRVYVVDTGGSIYKVDLTTAGAYTACAIANVGESVFTSMAVAVTGTTGTPKVRLFLGGAPNPDGSNNPAILSQYHAFAFDDNDPLGACTAGGASKVFSYAIAAPGKVWAAPDVSTGTAFFATASGSSESICDNGGGTLIPLSFDPATASVKVGTIATLTGQAASSIRIFDGHALVDVVGGTTNIVGKANTWNNPPAGGNANAFSVSSVSWYEY